MRTNNPELSKILRLQAPWAFGLLVFNAACLIYWVGFQRTSAGATGPVGAPWNWLCLLTALVLGVRTWFDAIGVAGWSLLIQQPLSRRRIFLTRVGVGFVLHVIVLGLPWLGAAATHWLIGPDGPLARSSDDWWGWIDVPFVPELVWVGIGGALATFPLQLAIPASLFQGHRPWGLFVIWVPITLMVIVLLLLVPPITSFLIPATGVIVLLAWMSWRSFASWRQTRGVPEGLAGWVARAVMALAIFYVVLLVCAVAVGLLVGFDQEGKEEHRLLPDGSLAGAAAGEATDPQTGSTYEFAYASSSGSSVSLVESRRWVDSLNLGQPTETLHRFRRVVYHLPADEQLVEVRQTDPLVVAGGMKVARRIDLRGVRGWMQWPADDPAQNAATFFAGAGGFYRLRVRGVEPIEPDDLSLMAAGSVAGATPGFPNGGLRSQLDPLWLLRLDGKLVLLRARSASTWRLHAIAEPPVEPGLRPNPLTLQVALDAAGRPTAFLLSSRRRGPAWILRPAEDANWIRLPSRASTSPLVWFAPPLCPAGLPLFFRVPLPALLLVALGSFVGLIGSVRLARRRQLHPLAAAAGGLLFGPSMVASLWLETRRKLPHPVPRPTGTRLIESV